VLFALGGTTCEAIMAAGDDKRYQPPGQLVDVGGYRLHLHCIGQGSPTVVLDAGLGGFSLDWGAVQPHIATSTRVCAYDRAGTTSASTSPPPVPDAAASPISTAAGSAGSPTGTTALVSCRTSAATLSAQLVPCAASQPLPQTHR
jgi:hypothetical protein